MSKKKKNNSLEIYEKKFEKIIKTFVTLGIAIFILAILISIVKYTINKKKNDSYDDLKMEEVISDDNFKIPEDGKTYYISANGTSTDGTDINDPMSLATAKRKRYNGNDKVLLKCGDTFYGTISFSVNVLEDEFFYIGSYGEGEKPIVSGANILINKSAWEEKNGIYKLDLSKFENFKGIGETTWEPYNIGFFCDQDGNIYGARKISMELMTNEYDFYCEGTYIYIKSDINPSEKLGEIKFIHKINLVSLGSNTILENIDVQYAGAHGIVNKNVTTDNVLIKNCIIQNIGGSLQYISTFTRYGNGIQFWNDASNTIVENCIIRNIYDAGYTTQGRNVTEELGFEKNLCKNNIFINCTYDVEMFCRNDDDNNAMCKLLNQQVYNNIFINEGRGWGYNVRLSKYSTATFVIWQFQKSNTSIDIENNLYYNPRRLKYINTSSITNALSKSAIISNNNKFYINKDTYILNNEGSYIDRKILDEYKMDQDSTFNLLSDVELNVVNNKYILNSNDYKKIKKYYEFLDEAEYKNKIDWGSIEGYKYIKNNQSVILLYNEADETQIPYTNYTATDIYGNKIQNTGTLTISKEPVLIYDLDEANLYMNISSEVINKINNYEQKYNIYLSTSNTMKNVLNKLENIKQQAESFKTAKTAIETATITKMIEDTYTQGDNIIKAFKAKELEVNLEDVCKMLTDLHAITEDMQKYYNTSIGNITKIDKSTEITKNINEFENIYQYYKNENIDYLLKLETMAKQQKEGITNETTNTNNFKTLTAYNLSSWANSLMIMYNDEFLSSISANIEYSNTQLTNQDVIARISSNVDIKVTNNSGKKEYTFTQNGEFTFKCELAGKAFEIKATVTNIDKTPPVITGVENEGFYTGSVTPKVTDTNLKEVKLYKNSTLVQNYATNSPIAEDGNYKIVATDKAGNETTVTFYICKIPATISYSETNLTNRNVTATINSNYDLQVTNNSGKKTYTFTNNGTFTFNYKIKGKAFTVTATVNNIDKKAPVITGVEEGKLYIDQAVIPKVTDENLKEVNLYLNSVQVSNFSSGTQVTKEGFYKIVATDKAGNQTTINFSLMKNYSKEYKVKGKYIINITSNTKKTDFVKNFNNTSQYQVTRNGKALTNNDIIATGDILKSNNGEEYTLIVTGDINKDGDVDVVDIVKLRRYLLLRNNLDEAALLAADCNLDGESLSVTDLVKLRLIVLYKGAT